MFTQIYIPELSSDSSATPVIDPQTVNRFIVLFFLVCLIISGLIIYANNAENPFGIAPSLAKKNS
jgi:hypothetical protein